MKEQPRIWRKLERHPMSAEYPDIGGPTLERMAEVVKTNGIANNRKVTLHPDANDNGKLKVLDGWQLLQACIAADVKPTFQMVPKGWTAEGYVEICNDLRRHETQEVAVARAVARRERVAAAREEGQSIRTIAENEGVSKTTVERDLDETGATVPGGTVEGKDGRKRPATQPKLLAELAVKNLSKSIVAELEKLSKTKQGEVLVKVNEGVDPKTALALVKGEVPTTPDSRTREPGDDTEEIETAKAEQKARPSNGAVLFDIKQFDRDYGALLRQVDRVGNAYQCKESKEATKLRDKLSAWKTDFKEWYAASKGAGKRAHAKS